MGRLSAKFLLAALGGALLLSSPAAGESANTCSSRERLVGFLADKYKEAPRAMGLVSNSGIMEVYVSTRGSWTIVVTSSKGTSCVIAAGESWEDMRVALKDPGA